MSHKGVLLARGIRSLPTESNTDFQPGGYVPILHSVLDRESVVFISIVCSRHFPWFHG